MKEGPDLNPGLRGIAFQRGIVAVSKSDGIGPPYGLNAVPGRAASMPMRARRDVWAETSDANRSGSRRATRVRFIMGG